MAERDQIAAAYTQVFGPSDATLLVLDDLVQQAGQQAEPLVKAGYTLAVHRILFMRGAERRAKARKD